MAFQKKVNPTDYTELRMHDLRHMVTVRKVSLPKELLSSNPYTTSFLNNLLSSST